MLVVVAREGDLTGDELVQLRTGAILSDGQQLFLSLCLASFSHLRPARLDSRLSPPPWFDFFLFSSASRCSPAGDRGSGERSSRTGGPGRETKRVTPGKVERGGEREPGDSECWACSRRRGILYFFFFKETRIEPLGPIVRPLGGHEGQGKYASSPAADAHVEAGPRGGGRCNEGVKRLAHDDEREHKR